MNSLNNPFEYKPQTRTELFAANAGKPGVILITLISSIILMAGTFSYTAHQSSIDKLNLQLGSEQRLHAFEISRHASQASSAVVTAFPLLQAAAYRYDEILNMFSKGDDSIGLPPLTGEASEQLQRIAQTWPKINQDVDTILREEGIIRMMKEFIIALNELMPELQAEIDKANNILRQGKNNQDEIYHLSQVSILTQRITNHANRALILDSDTQSLLNDLKQDNINFSNLYKSLTGKVNGSEIRRIDNKSALKVLTNADAIFETWRELATRVEETAPQLVAAQSASRGIYNQIEVLLEQTSALLENFNTQENTRNIGNFIGYSLGLLSLALLVRLGLSLTRATRHRLRVETEQNKRTENAILELLNELAPLAEGDLTGETTVTEEITGAIADAINFVVDELRNTVSQINNMTHTVSEHADDTRATTLQLAQASERQTAQIISVTNKIESMADSISDISQNAQQSAGVARTSVQAAERGASAVSNTIDSMKTLQANIKSTAITIKRLGESSQEIGDIVELIKDISEQTNILALNAAIHAHNTGQNNAEITNLSDEIFQLADKVSDSTQNIETLITTIQLDTKRAVESMERNTESVSESMRLATVAGNSLLQIESVSRQLAGLIKNISTSAQNMNSNAVDVAKTMSQIKQFTQQNLAGTRHSAQLVGELSDLARAQQQTVARFKLPAPTSTSHKTEQ